MIGKKIGNWEIVEQAPSLKNGVKMWKCRCKCGSERLWNTSYLNTGQPTCCHKCRKINKDKEEKQICQKYIGTKHGTYTVVKALERNYRGSRRWLCRCQCGYERVFLTANLSGNGKRKATTCEKCNLHKMELDHRITDKIPHRFWQRFLDHSKRRNKEVAISQDEAYELYNSQNKCCALTKLPLYFTTLRTNFNRYTNASIDRIDSSKPYSKDNIQWVHKVINMMKQGYSQEEFIEMCQLVAANAM
jgi:hypothetical protein